jgi:hypothetical protein
VDEEALHQGRASLLLIYDIGFTVSNLKQKAAGVIRRLFCFLKINHGSRSRGTDKHGWENALKLAPVKPSPDFGGEGNEGEGVFDFEGPFGGLVAEEVHAQQAARPAADGAEQGEKGFRHA